MAARFRVAVARSARLLLASLSGGAAAIVAIRLAFRAAAEGPSLAAAEGHHAHLHQGSEVAHHLTHLVVVSGAALVFCIYVTAYAVKNGWPSFSWRLRPRDR